MSFSYPFTSAESRSSPDRFVSGSCTPCLTLYFLFLPYADGESAEMTAVFDVAPFIVWFRSS